MSTPTNPFNDIFKPITDAFNQAAEQIALATQCKMRRFYLERDSEIVASGVLYEDGAVSLRWKPADRSKPGNQGISRVAHTSMYDNIHTLEQRTHSVIKYIDPEKP